MYKEPRKKVKGSFQSSSCCFTKKSPTNKMIIRFLGETVKRYLEEFQKGFTDLNKRCPICNGNCNRHGTYQRYINENDQFILIPIQRLKCKQCNWTHAIIPNIVRPYSQYKQNIREEVMDLVRSGVPNKVDQDYHGVKEQEEDVTAQTQVKLDYDALNDMITSMMRMGI